MGIELLLDELRSFHEEKGPDMDGPIDDKFLDYWQEITRDISDNATGAVRILDDLLVRMKETIASEHIINHSH
jgi:hypothetical protein